MKLIVMSQRHGAKEIIAALEADCAGVPREQIEQTLFRRLVDIAAKRDLVAIQHDCETVLMKDRDLARCTVIAA